MPTRAVQIRAGQVDVNAALFNPGTPFGGQKHFGIRREIADYGIDDMLKVKAVQP
jgi:acyl-CoA reductase-like NAD-dependent aldehyde dehydrogenase